MLKAHATLSGLLAQDDIKNKCMVTMLFWSFLGSLV